MKLWLLLFLFLMGGAYDVYAQKIQIPPKNKAKMNYRTCATSACHSAIKNSRYLHQPLKTGGCYLCHKPVLNTHQFKLFRNFRKMCVQCHDDMAQKNFIKKQGQLVLKTDFYTYATHSIDFKKSLQADIKLYNDKIECLSCHDPHGSSQSHLLKKIDSKGAQAALCYQCHENQFTPNMHPMKKDQCFDCHGFHKGKLKTPLLKMEKKGQGLICFECHREKKNLHKTGHDYLNWSAAQMSFTKESFHLTKNLSNRCQVCHDMHGSQTDGSLLVASKLSPHKFKIDSACLSCHKNPKAAAIKQIKHFFQHRPILISAVQDKDSGKEIIPDFFTPLAKKIKDPTEARSLSCATCHDPHVWSQNARFSKSGAGSPPKMMKFCAGCHGQDAYALYTKFHEYENRGKQQDGD